MMPNPVNGRWTTDMRRADSRLIASIESAAERSYLLNYELHDVSSNDHHVSFDGVLAASESWHVSIFAIQQSP